MKAIQFFKPFILKNYTIFLVAIVFGILNSFVTLLLPLSLGRFYELVINGNSNKGQILNSFGLKLGESFADFLIIFFTLIIAKGVFEYLYNFYKETVGEKFIAELRLKNFSNHLNNAYASHKKKPTGKYFNKYVSDFSNIRIGLTKGIITFICDLFFSFFSLLILLKISPILTFILVLSLVLNVICLSWMEQSLRKKLAEKHAEKANYINFIFDRLGAFLAIKLFSRERIEQKRFVQKMEAYKKSNLSYLKAKSFETAFIQFGIYLIIFFVIVAIYILAKSPGHNFQIGQLISYLLLVFALKPIIRRFLKVDKYHKNAIRSISQLNGNSYKEISTKELKFHAGYITFNHVSFGYSDQKMVVTDLSFDARNGEITRIKGQSGSGKSTIFRLITKLYSPQKGIIFVDGQNIALVNDTTKYISIISDDIPLLGKTVYEVVCEARNEVNRRRTINVLAKLQYIFNLTNGLYLDRSVENGGANLSSVERKVVSIARGIVNEKPILLIDEPFLGLDDNMVSLFAKYLDNIKKNKTIIVIASGHCQEANFDKEIDLENDFFLNKKPFLN